jgi:hypothetical protein
LFESPPVGNSQSTTKYTKDTKIEFSKYRFPFHFRVVRVFRGFSRQKRYLAAIKSLALIRKLSLPVLQLNFAKKQVNMAGPYVTGMK